MERVAIANDNSGIQNLEPQNRDVPHYDRAFVEKALNDFRSIAEKEGREDITTELDNIDLDHLTAVNLAKLEGMFHSLAGDNIVDPGEISNLKSYGHRLGLDSYTVDTYVQEFLGKTNVALDDKANQDAENNGVGPLEVILTVDAYNDYIMSKEKEEMAPKQSGFSLGKLWDETKKLAYDLYKSASDYFAGEEDEKEAEDAKKAAKKGMFTSQTYGLNEGIEQEQAQAEAVKQAAQKETGKTTASNNPDKENNVINLAALVKGKGFSNN